MFNNLVRSFNPRMVPRATARSPRAQAAAARPDRPMAILLAAEKLFAQRGYHAVTIRQIAEEAGVPLALVGYHFGPKRDLFRHLCALEPDHRRASGGAARDPAGPG